MVFGLLAATILASGRVLKAIGMILIGLLPGRGATLASFGAPSVEKKVLKHPERFGTGVVKGVAAPEAANNAAAQASFIPLPTLGIPFNDMMAMMLSAFMIHGITPGPTVLTSQPEIFWGLVASMGIGKLLLVVINLPMIGLWVKLLTVPCRLLYPAILLFCCIGVYSMNNRIFDVILAAGFGLLGCAVCKAKVRTGAAAAGLCAGSAARDEPAPDDADHPGRSDHFCRTSGQPGDADCDRDPAGADDPALLSQDPERGVSGKRILRGSDGWGIPRQSFRATGHRDAYRCARYCRAARACRGRG